MLIKVYISEGTNNVLQREADLAVKKYCKEYSVEEALVRAIIKQESMEYPYAIRHEPHLHRAKWYTKLIPKEYKKDKFAYSSMGYMQVLYGIARDYGFKGTPHDLFTPDNSIRYGVRHLQKLIKRHYYLTSAVSAYNQGSPRRRRDTGEFKNQAYVDKVLKYYKSFGGVVQ